MLIIKVIVIKILPTLTAIGSQSIGINNAQLLIFKVIVINDLNDNDLDDLYEQQSSVAHHQGHCHQDLVSSSSQGEPKHRHQ